MAEPPLDIRPDHLEMVRAILREHVPQCEVWAFGSRARWTAKEYSDLDMAVITDESLSLSVSAALAEDFSESDLPYKVDVVDWATTDESFRRIIEGDKVVVQECWKGSSVSEQWPRYPFGELTYNFDSHRIPVKEVDRKWGQYPYYGASGVVDYVDSSLFDGDYLLIAEDGENLRTRNTPIAFLARGKFWVNNHAHIVQGNDKADTQYLMYAFQETDIGGYLTGSTMPKLTQGNMNRILIPAPPLKEQRAIASILGALDDKIELNRRMNQTLEGIAQAIFKSWFVDFDPVRDKMEGRKPFGMDAETAALFPEAFEESELGEIPNGWIVKRLSELCKAQYGYTASSAEEPIGPKFLRVKDINKQNWIVWGEVPYCSINEKDKTKYSLKVGDIVIARMADPGKSGIIEEPIDAVFASYLVRLSTNDLYDAYYVYGFLKSPFYEEYSLGAMGGSVQANMNAQVIVSVKFLVPPPEVRRAYADRIIPLRQRIVSNLRETAILASLCDTLLPKLLSGEIRIKDAEKIVEATL